MIVVVVYYIIAAAYFGTASHTFILYYIFILNLQKRALWKRFWTTKTMKMEIIMQKKILMEIKIMIPIPTKVPTHRQQSQLHKLA